MEGYNYVSNNQNLMNKYLLIGGVVVMVAFTVPFSASAYRGVVNESNNGSYNRPVYYTSYTRGYQPSRSIVNNGTPTYATKTHYYPVTSRRVIN